MVRFTLVSPRFALGKKSSATLLLRHARPCAGHPRLPLRKKGVDGRDKPGHDGFTSEVSVSAGNRSPCDGQHSAATALG
jgi:hypothetical protein